MLALPPSASAALSRARLFNAVRQHSAPNFSRFLSPWMIGVPSYTTENRGTRIRRLAAGWIPSNSTRCLEPAGKFKHGAGGKEIPFPTPRLRTPRDSTAGAFLIFLVSVAMPALPPVLGSPGLGS
jgi:hypothetical protein